MLGAEDLVDCVELSSPPWPVRFTLTAPGSKSASVRVLLLAALSGTETTITGLLDSDDTAMALGIVRQLGADVQRGRQFVRIGGTDGHWLSSDEVLFAGDSATVSRFTSGLLAASPRDGQWTMATSPANSRRDSHPLVSTLRGAGCDVRSIRGPATFPLEIRGGASIAREIHVDAGVSSQFASAALFAALGTERQCAVVLPQPWATDGYVRMTIEAFRDFGHRVKVVNETVTVWRESADAPRHLRVEPDLSSAAYAAALGVLTGGVVRITDIPSGTHQPDLRFFNALTEFGAELSYTGSELAVKGPTRLRGGFTLDMERMADQALTVGVLAVFADAPVTVTGVARIRGHESDRIAALADCLARIGVGVDVESDGFTVRPAVPRPANVHSWNDHRVAMSMSLCAAAVPGMSVIDTACVAKSYPGFFATLQDAGFKIRHYSQIRDLA
jgi:3-phosphoshikimate 1-carboxyvinyltransferase